MTVVPMIPFRTLSFALPLLLAACGSETKAVERIPPSADAISVTAAKARSGDAKVATFGRVAHLVPGFAVVRLMDSELPYCGEKEPEDKCKTPWDYCCETPETRAEKALLVEARGEDGKPKAASTMPELRLLDLVEVRGTMAIDDHGNPVLLASEWRRLERPELPDGLRWPH